MPTRREFLLIIVSGIIMLVLFNLMSDINERQRDEYRATMQNMENEIACLFQALNPIDFEVHVWEATAYAPLDPDAVEGVCYAGDPNITASGLPIEPGISVAAGPSVPFGTWLWIEGLGWRRVDDRGGAIRDGSIDICMITREDAIRFGRRKVTVIIPKWEEVE
jgi:3D (Asp-Asp-Asp) domain-containing protein